MSNTISSQTLFSNKLDKKTVQDWLKDLDSRPDLKVHKMRMQICELIGLTSVLYRSVSFCTDDYEEQILDHGIADLGGDTCVLSIVHTQLKNIEKDLSLLQTHLKEEKDRAKNELIETQT